MVANPKKVASRITMTETSSWKGMNPLSLKSREDFDTNSRDVSFLSMAESKSLKDGYGLM